MVREAIREKPCNIFYVNEVFRNNYEIFLECVKADPNTNEYATLHLKNKIFDLAIFYIEKVVQCV